MSDSPITHRSFISYIDRTREFYAAQGYERPYRWAHHSTVPFTPLAKPLAESRVTVVTTASLFSDQGAREGVLRGGKQVWSGETAFTPDHLYTDDLAWDKENTHTNDVESFVPLGSLRTLVKEGRIEAAAGCTKIFITPGFEFQIVGGLLTNFHLPRSTLLMLVSAFASQGLIMDAYAHAIREKYRF